MRYLTCVLVAGGVLWGTAVQAEPQGRGRAQSEVRAADGSGFSGKVEVLFSSGDIRLIRSHYGPRYRGLNRGMQKKLVRTGQLPPGWQKKMEPFPLALERQLSTLPPGYARGVIDGHAVIYKPGAAVVIDATILF
jgi:hypothetical protein